eukprot:scaffold42798_cov66-Phaeocystis_antarctica.AAC.3
MAARWYETTRSSSGSDATIAAGTNTRPPQPEWARNVLASAPGATAERVRGRRPHRGPVGQVEDGVMQPKCIIDHSQHVKRDHRLLVPESYHPLQRPGAQARRPVVAIPEPPVAAIELRAE